MHADTISSENLFERLIDEMKDNPAYLLLNTIPEDHHVVMGQRYLIDLVNATLPSLLEDDDLRAKEADVCS